MNAALTGNFYRMTYGTKRTAGARGYHAGNGRA
jgi:hypothetical protein